MRVANLKSDPSMATIACDSLKRGGEFLVATQESDGAWRVPPHPRILENALACVVADAFAPQLRQDVEAARRFVREADVQARHPVARALDTWLRLAALSQAATLDLSDPAFDEPAFVHRKVLFSAIALALESPTRAALSRLLLLDRLLGSLRSRHVARLKSWSSAEVAGLVLLLADRVMTAEISMALAAVKDAQFPTGSFGENPVSTMIAIGALSRWSPDAPELTKALKYLRDAKAADGTWRFSVADVWDTALLVRSFASWPELNPIVRRKAEDFLASAQNDDGGFAYRQGVESDTDSTGVCLLALGHTENRPVIARAQQYLVNTRTEQGVWRTWHHRDDPPAEDAVAHAVVGLERSGAPAELWLAAKAWLGERVRARIGWQAHWYNSQPYAAHEVGLALGRVHLATRYAAGVLRGRQNADGGWGVDASSPSTPAATGMALALMSQYLSADDPIIVKAVSYLCDAQNDDGAWVGPSDGYWPRPFSVHCPIESHALAAIGMVAVANKRVHVGNERRRLRTTTDFLEVTLTDGGR